MNDFFKICETLVVVSGCFGLGALIASFIVSQFLYNNKDDEEKTEEQTEQTEEEEYTSKYNLEHLELVILDDDTKNELKSIVCTDETPAGKVLLTYKEPDFVYYARSGNVIPYRFLDTVARKFVTENNCLEIYTKFELMLDDTAQAAPQNETTESNEEKPEKEVNSVFITKKKIIKKREIIKKSMNVFKYGGTIQDFEEKKTGKPENEGKKMTFADYKRLMEKSKKEE